MARLCFLLYQKEKVHFRLSARYLAHCRFGPARLSKESGATDVTNVFYPLLHGNGTIMALKRDEVG
jgi:hypothetical protein